MNEFLNDKTFLLKLNQYPIHEYYALINVLEYSSERIIKSFTNKIISCNLTINGQSSVRRNGSIKICGDKDTSDITDLNNLIAINKKIKISIGIKNPWYNTTMAYRRYGETLWFPQGVMIIENASLAYPSITLNITDKMALLNGTCGGTFPASVNLHESIKVLEDGSQIIEYPLIKDIIYELVSHFGEEHPSRIIIEDVPEVGRQVAKYVGSYPFYLYARTDDSSYYGRDYQLTTVDPSKEYDMFEKGDLIGYMETPLTYPGELIVAAGANVAQALDTIKNALGNFEYFYDTDGIFHFRKIRDFQSTGNAPLNYNDFDSQINSSLQSLYFPKYSNYQYINEFANKKLITQAAYNPSYSNIKNDFICWGTRNSTKSNIKTMVRYHLTIDEKPQDIVAGENKSLCHQDIYAVYDHNGKLIKYSTVYQIGYKTVLFIKALDRYYSDSRYHFNWREELYRKALLAYGTSTVGSIYDEELLAEWRNIFDPENTAFKTKWNQYSDKLGTWYGYNPDVVLCPSNLRYWLDILDSPALEDYKISKIGRRSYVKNNSQINEIFSLPIPDVVFVENKGEQYSTSDLKKKHDYYNSIGQEYCTINSDVKSLFGFVNSLGSCYEDIRMALYTNLIYKASVFLSILPILYLDVNSVVHLNLKDEQIVGDYCINSISLQISNKANTMSLNLSEAQIII